MLKLRYLYKSITILMQIVVLLLIIRNSKESNEFIVRYTPCSEIWNTLWISDALRHVVSMSSTYTNKLIYNPLSTLVFA